MHLLSEDVEAPARQAARSRADQRLVILRRDELDGCGSTNF